MKRPDYKGHAIETFVLRGDDQGPFWTAAIDGTPMGGGGWDNEPAAWAGAQVEIRRRERGDLLRVAQRETDKPVVCACGAAGFVDVQAVKWSCRACARAMEEVR